MGERQPGVHKRRVSLLTAFAIVLFFGLFTAFSHQLLIQRMFKQIVQTIELQTEVAEVNSLADELTVVTAYFSIGSFGKGGKSAIRKPEDTYRKWINAFSRLDSLVVAYFDDDETVNVFRSLRGNLPTVIQKVNRSELWTFQMLPAIEALFARPDYAKHYPNTINPLYSAAVNAKYELTRLTVLNNPFRTKYFCWLDIGYFRDIALKSLNESDTFSLYLPPGFMNDSVAYTEIRSRNVNASPRDIVYYNIDWLAGGFFIAEARVMLRWTEEHRRAMHDLLYVRSLMGADQQVIYSALNTMNLTTKLQLYTPDGRYNEWFHLGYLASEAGKARNRTRQLTATN